MKVFILICAILLILTGCNPAPTNNKGEIQNYTVKTIEGCEYIEISFMTGGTSGLYSLTHKGNCKNPIHTCSFK